MEVSNKSHMPHIVAFPFPTQGHINPMLVLCQRLSSSFGFCITFVNSNINHARLMERGDPVLDAEQNLKIRFVGIPDGLDCLSPGMDGVREAIAASNSMKGPFQELVDNMIRDGPGVCCILCDTMVGWTQDVANEFDIPLAAYSTTCATNDLIASSLPQLMDQGYVPLNFKADYMEPNHRIACIPGIRPLHPMQLPFACRMKHQINSHVCDTYTRLPEADFVLVNSIAELEENAVEAMRNIASNYLPIGPVLPIVYTDSKQRHLSAEETKCLEWLNGQDPNSVLYVSFGSIACLSKLQIEHLLSGLQAAEQPFLLVMRDSLVFGLCGNFYSDFLDATKDFGYITSWAPQMEVLGHSAVGGFLSHCGWNSTLESIYNGVPMLGWPCIAEQNLNCMLLVEEWGVAYGFKEREDRIIEQKEVEEKVRKLMQKEEGQVLRKKMWEMRDKVRQAVQEGGSSRSNLETFANALKANSARLSVRRKIGEEIISPTSAALHSCEIAANC